ncbi:MAG: leucine-rich repeat protein, partial [Clostridia bacterium]|nr:leucine-rich repeat protein [Clostridia bacterium]
TNFRSIVTFVDHNYVDGICSMCGQADPDAYTIVSTEQYNGRLTFEVREMADGSHTLVVSGTGAMPTVKQAAGYAFLNYSATTTKVIIEEGVTTVGYGIFNGWTALASVELPFSLTTIDGESFRGCTALKAIEIPYGVTTLGYGAFWGAGLESVVIPESVVDIKNYVFYRCKSLVSAEIYGSTEYKVGDKTYSATGARMFYECSNLENIVLGDVITLLNTYTFHGAALTEFTVPARVKFIYDAAFHSNTKMTSFTMEEGVTYLGWAALFGCSSLTDVSIPSTITGGNIATWAFGACTSLESIELPAGLTNLKKRTFSGCTSLKSIELPAGVTALGDRVFIGCTALESVKLSNITAILEQTFNNCPKLTSITIPETVTSIGSLAFRLNESLKTVYVDSATIAAGLTGNAVYGNIIKWAETIAIRADITGVPNYVKNNYPYVGARTVDGVDYVTYSTNVSALIRQEEGLTIGDYQQQMANFDITDPVNTVTYTETEKAAQRRAGSTMQIDLDAAIAIGSSYFKVEPGVYRFADQIPFALYSVRDMYIDVSGCTFILESAQRFALCHDTKNVIIQGPVVIDREGGMATQFRVQAYDAASKTLTVKLLDGYSLSNAVTGGGSLQWFEDDGSMIQMSFITYTSAAYADEANGIVTFHGVTCDSFFGHEVVLKAGQLGAVAITGSMTQAVGLYSCKDIYLMDITNYGSGMMMHVMAHEGDLTLKRVYNVRMPGTNRLVAGSAGQLAFASGTPVVENCIFGFCEDDSIDIMGHVSFLYEQETANTVVIKGTTSAASPVHAGDTLHFYDAESYTRTYTAKVVKVETITNSAYNQNAWNTMVQDYSFFESLTTQPCVRVTLDKNVAVKQGDMVENMDYSRPFNAVLRNNYFHDMGCRVLIQGCKGLLFENNLIERSGLGALVLDCEQRDWGEGPNSYDVVIRNNTIRESNSSSYSNHFVFVHSGAISVGPYQWYHGDMTPTTATDSYQNITIEGNSIYDANYSGILVKNSSNVTIKNNYIQNPVTKLCGPHTASGAPQNSTPGVYYYGEQPDYAIYLYACEEITLSGNTVEDAGEYCLGEVRELKCK